MYYIYGIYIICLCNNENQNEDYQADFQATQCSRQQFVMTCVSYDKNACFTAFHINLRYADLDNLIISTFDDSFLIFSLCSLYFYVSY